ncbi:hypothetical protein O5O45_12295 [Hahella aquimaris]|uniref:hypothetical protein n=1 Tax=Hahella sp. HNIBRBA332 TaxID=3015983 RepID=UPI00273C5997|nr:hypothetical protein [Hahella sp. HNIBRBA332]WLQ16698.1 hypothetical protein O5O45_12295 [Hahella sp. HNIBRBA332]
MSRLTFDANQRFKQLDEGLLYASAGVQTNCSGIAAILVRICSIDSLTLEYKAVTEPKLDDSEALGLFSGEQTPKAYVEAVFDGAREMFRAAQINGGYRVELVQTLIHPVDARVIKFREAGMRAARGWLTDVGLMSPPL